MTEPLPNPAYLNVLNLQRLPESYPLLSEAQDGYAAAAIVREQLGDKGKDTLTRL
jgi:hypothetical protein